MAPAAVSIFDAHLFFAETTEFSGPNTGSNSVVDFLEADILTGAGNADVDPSTVPAEAAKRVLNGFLSVRCGPADVGR